MLGLYWETLRMRRAGLEGASEAQVAARLASVICPPFTVVSSHSCCGPESSPNSPVAQKAAVEAARSEIKTTRGSQQTTDFLILVDKDGSSSLAGEDAVPLGVMPTTARTRENFEQWFRFVILKRAQKTIDDAVAKSSRALTFRVYRYHEGVFEFETRP